MNRYESAKICSCVESTSMAPSGAMKTLTLGEPMAQFGHGSTTPPRAARRSR